MKLDPSEIGFAYNFGNSDVATDILDNYWSTGQPKHGHGNGNGYDDEDDSQDVKFGKGLADTTEEDDKGKVKATQPVRTRVSFELLDLERCADRLSGHLYECRDQAVQNSRSGST